MENSIEEAIKVMEHWIEYEKNNKEKINRADELINIQETILSAYKRVLKENEILKEEKEQAWEEWNNLEQGSYETEQKLKQQIKESQKENEELRAKWDKDTHILQNKLDYANADRIDLAQQNKELRKENEELKNKLSLKQFDVNIVYNDYLEKLDEYERNNIPKSKLKDIIDRIDYDIKKTKEIISKNTNIYASYRKNDYQIVRLRAMNTKSLDIKKRLQELLESEE